MPQNKFPDMSHFSADPFVMHRRLPSILLDSWEFRKIASEGSVLPNALLSCDVDEDGVDEIIIGTTEGYVVVVKPDLRVFNLVHTMTATIAIVMYSKELHQLILVTLEGQCEVWDDFLVTPNHDNEVWGERDKEHASKTSLDATGPDLNRAGAISSGGKPRDPSTYTACQTKSAQKPSKVFHVPSNCMCGDIVVEGDVSRLFLGSYDCHLYIYDLCSGVCELFIFMHHAVTSLKCFSLPVGLDLMMVSFPPSENANASINPSGPKIDGPNSLRGKCHAMGATNSFRSDENVESVQLPDPSRHLAVPLLFVATMQSLVLVPASLSTLRSRQDKENESNKPLVLADESIMRHNFNPSRNSRRRQEFTSSGTNFKDKSPKRFQDESRGECKHTVGSEIDNEGRDRPSARYYARSSWLSQSKRYSTSLRCPITLSTTSLDFYQANQVSGHSISNKDAASCMFSDENFKTNDELPETSPIDAAPSIVLIYPLWVVSIRWHLLGSKQIPTPEALFSLPSYLHRVHPYGTGVQVTMPTHSADFSKFSHHVAKSKCSDAEDDSFLSLSPSYSSSSSTYAIMDVSEFDEGDDDNMYREKEASRTYVASSAKDHQSLPMEKHQHASPENQPLHTVPSISTCADTQNVSLQLHSGTEKSSSSQRGPYSLSPSHVVSTSLSKETGVLSCLPGEAIMLEKRAAQTGITKPQTSLSGVLSVQRSRPGHGRMTKCIHSPVFVDVSVDRGSVILVAAREDGRVCVLQLTSDHPKADPVTAGDTEQSSVGSSEDFPFSAHRRGQRLSSRAERLQHSLSLASLDPKRQECQQSDKLTPSRRPFAYNEVRIPFSSKRGVSVATATHADSRPSASSTQLDIKLTNSSLTGYASKGHSFGVGEDPTVHTEIGGLRGSQPSHVETDTKAALPNMVTPREYRADSDILLCVGCLWAGILEDPLVQRTCVVHVAEDAIRVVLVSATGKCYTVDPTTGTAVECSVSVDCSSFTLIKELVVAASDENSSAMGPYPLVSSFSSQHSPLFYAFSDTATALAHTMSSVFSKRISGGPHDVAERAVGVGNSLQHTKSLCGVFKTLIRIACVSVDELCIYSTNEIHNAPTHHPRHALSPLSKEFLDLSEFVKNDECRNSGVTPFGLFQRGLSRVQRSLSHLFCHSYGRNDEFGSFADDNDEIERALLLELGTTLQELDSRYRKEEKPDDIDQTEVKDAEDLIFYARQVLTKGYSGAEWQLLSNLDRSLRQGST
ncbi:unnamed protein product [Phytomonas sp. EM1]|nr:unnamed protein product [Phytomonas sp. EM1]|eukprot:CCW59831.1 unnamed protein product [Phytomonas sp. isolate EM1]